MCKNGQRGNKLPVLVKGLEMIPNDPVILLGFMNTKLRDQYKNLEILCDDLQCNRKEIERKLESIDYRYNENQNQFR